MLRLNAVMHFKKLLIKKIKYYKGNTLLKVEIKYINKKGTNLTFSKFTLSGTSMSKTNKTHVSCVRQCCCCDKPT